MNDFAEQARRSLANGSFRPITDITLCVSGPIETVARASNADYLSLSEPTARLAAGSLRDLLGQSGQDHFGVNWLQKDRHIG